jgi:CRISPR-associated protein Csb1
MTIKYSELQNVPRLLLEATLKPQQGDRFQPTGFADMGAARYTLPNGTNMLLMESAQSVANHMELACCKNDKKTLLDELNGLPYIVSMHKSKILTTSYLEAHRLASPYLLSKEWAKKLSEEMKLKDDYQINDKAVMGVIFKYDPCSLIHGVWLGTKNYKNEFSGGRVRVTRMLSGFIEAKNYEIAQSGGTKFDKNAARLTETGDAETGYGTLPFHRTEFTAEEITAYFNLDLALLRGYGLHEYGLHENAEHLLIALALLKVRRFLSTGLRLRTACNLEVVGDIKVVKPDKFTIPDEVTLLAECKRLITECNNEKLFADPCITEVNWEPKKNNVTVTLPVGTTQPEIPNELKEKVEWKKQGKKDGPKLVLKEQPTEEFVNKIKKLFEGNDAAVKAIDDEIKKQSSDEDKEESETGDKGDQ